MEAIVFVRNYLNYLDEIESVVKPELLPILEEIRQIDAHDWVGPDSWFHDENHARGFVWSLFLGKALHKL